MYHISTSENYLLVKFEEDFDYYTIQTIIHHETMLAEYERMNDVWLIGKCHALITLDELESMATAFKCMCPRGATREKTAIVVEPGLTEAIVELWIKEVAKKVPFELRIFHTLEEAEEWLGAAGEKVA